VKTVSGKQFARILERRGWTLLRIQGSHHIYGKPGSEIRISLPIHRNDDLKAGLQRHFMKIAEVTEADLG
jgi:predicted RNA binding protein YcfA (HicA-like mRNA interferase family)